MAHKRETSAKECALLLTQKHLIEEGSDHGNKGSIGAPRAVNEKPFKQLTSKELEEKMSKGLWFVCDKRYMQGTNIKGNNCSSLMYLLRKVPT